MRVSLILQKGQPEQKDVAERLGEIRLNTLVRFQRTQLAHVLATRTPHCSRKRVRLLRMAPGCLMVSWLPVSEDSPTQNDDPELRKLTDANEGSRNGALAALTTVREPPLLMQVRQRVCWHFTLPFS